MNPTTSHLHADAVRELTAYAPEDPGQRRLREHYLAHLAHHPDAMAKTGPPAHLTASCLVLDPSGQHVLLTLHRRAHRWFQFGGHVEALDAGVHAAAQREAREESGVSGIEAAPGIVQLDRHELVGDFGPCRAHLDIRYAALLDREVAPVVSAESLDVRWWPVDSLPDGPDSELASLARAARRHLGLA